MAYELTDDDKERTIIGALVENQRWLETFEDLLARNDEVWAGEKLKDFHKLNVATLSGLKEQAELAQKGYLKELEDIIGAESARKVEDRIKNHE